ADGVPRHHGDDRLGQPANLDLEIKDVQPSDPLLVPVSVVPSDPLVSTGTEGVRALPREDHHADLGIVSGPSERLRELGQGPGAEGVSDLGPGDGDLGHPLRRLVPHVLERFRLAYLTCRAPRSRTFDRATWWRSRSRPVGTGPESWRRCGRSARQC